MYLVLNAEQVLVCEAGETLDLNLNLAPDPVFQVSERFRIPLYRSNVRWYPVILSDPSKSVPIRIQVQA
jgi:hypothetical protein